MFKFRQNKPASPLGRSNPGIGVEAKVAFSTGDRNWTEKANLVDLAFEVFKKQGYSVRKEKTWLEDNDSGFLIFPQLVGIQPLKDGGVQSTTTMQTNHATLAPKGVFEYQHSTGDSLADSISKGFDQWLQTDFVVLREALRPKPESCMVMEMAFPAQEAKPARVRRAILGPIAHFLQKPPSTTEGNDPEEHPFCPCCMFTKSIKAFKELIEGDGFYGLRFFAARNAEAVPQSDCRVNGEDWEKGAQALREYAKTWPPAGFEFRKQYVVLQSMDKGTES